MEKKSIVITCRTDLPKAIKLTRKILEYLENKNESVFLDRKLAHFISPSKERDLASLTNEEIKFVISIGGDGTILRVASALSRQNNPPPIFGVNIGSVGFLDESTEVNAFKDLNNVLNNEYIVEKCSRIAPFIVRGNLEEQLSNALNEILIVSSNHSKIMHSAIKINGIFIDKVNSDGVIISTSTGSTAYNLSAGGAIVAPSLEIVQITPLNIFTRNGLKPIVLPIDCEIEIKLLRPYLYAQILIDGQISYKKVLPNTTIRIRKVNAHTKFIRLSENVYSNYISRLRQKIIPSMNSLENLPKIY